MAEPKTKPTDVDPCEHIVQTVDVRQRPDALRILDIFANVTGETPVMWGPSIIGFGRYTVGEGAKAAIWPLTGFAIAKAKFTFYVGARNPDVARLLPELGAFKPGGGCIYIARLADINETVLRQIIDISAKARKGED